MTHTFFYNLDLVMRHMINSVPMILLSGQLPLEFKHQRRNLFKKLHEVQSPSSRAA